MSDRKPRRFFWFEGVTRAEVERSLNDTRPSVLRRQAPRRQLVVATALVVLILYSREFRSDVLQVLRD